MQTPGVPVSTTPGRRIAPRRSYWSTKSPHEVAFHARYVELILDSLMKAPPEKPLWCRHARKHLDRSREEREKQVWKGAPPGAAFLEAIDDPVRDEAMWSIARILDQLYSTQEFGAQAPGPMLVADDRYFVHRASAALPAPEARSALTLRAWSRILTDLADTDYVDVLLWAVQFAKPELVLGELIEGLTESLKESGNARRKDGDDAEWKDAWASFQERVPAALGSRLSEPLAGLTLAEADSFVGDVVGEAPQPYIPKRYSGVRAIRLRALEEALGRIVEAVPEEPALDDPFTEYFALEARREPLEREATDEVRRQLQGASFDIILPVRVAVTTDLPVSLGTLGFELAEDTPGLDPARKEPGIRYARFNSLQARGTDHAVEQARLRLRLALARAGMFAEGVVGFEILDGFIRFAGSPMWGTADRGWRIRGATLGAGAFDAVTDIADLLVADDELAVRTQEAVVHLHRASLTTDSEEAFDEAWKVLEIMTGKASTCGAGLIAYFPLIKAPRGLKKLLGADRDAFVKSEYRENLELFEQIEDIRNQNVVHRNIARADWHVLEQHAAVAISFARDAVQLAITAWKSPELAAREPAGLMKWLEAAYKSMSITLPKQNDLTPE